jgi:fumarylpyruvate hydrolase
MSGTMHSAGTSAPERLAIPGPRPVRIPVAGSDACFPVRRIYCVGRNYAAHIREMQGNEREPPFFFQKPSDAVVLSGSTVPYPSATADFQHEIELVIAIGRSGVNIGVEDAHRHVFGLAAGIDLTRRDLQLKARDSGRPWESGKAFDQSAAISPIHEWSRPELPRSGAITLSVNAEVKQRGDIGEMIWACDEIISQLSTLYRLEPGDLIYTGTPAGVGKMVSGDVVEGSVEGVDTVRIVIG